MRRTYVYDPITKQMIPKELSRPHDAGRGPLVMGDMPDFVSPVDGSIVHGRRGWREHSKIHGVTHMSDYKNHWEAKAKERARFYTEGPANTKEAVIRAFDTLSRGKR